MFRDVWQKLCSVTNAYCDLTWLDIEGNLHYFLTYQGVCVEYFPEVRLSIRENIASPVLLACISTNNTTIFWETSYNRIIERQEAIQLACDYSQSYNPHLTLKTQQSSAWSIVCMCVFLSNTIPALALSQCPIPTNTYDCATNAMLATHPRVGQSSNLRHLPRWILQNIVTSIKNPWCTFWDMIEDAIGLDDNRRAMVVNHCHAWLQHAKTRVCQTQ